MRSNVDWDDKHANAHGFTIDDSGKTHDVKPRLDARRAKVRKRRDNPRGVSLGGQDIDKEK